MFIVIYRFLGFEHLWWSPIIYDGVCNFALPRLFLIFNYLCVIEPEIEVHKLKTSTLWTYFWIVDQQVSPIDMAHYQTKKLDENYNIWQKM